MKARFRLLFLLVIIFVSITSSTIKGIDINDKFTYEIVDAGYYVKIGRNTGQLEEYRFNHEEYSIGTKINATYKISEFPGMDKFRFNIFTKGKDVYFSEDWFDSSVIQMSYRSLYYVYNMVENFDLIDVAELVLYQIKPYISPENNTYIESPNQLGLDLYTLVDSWSISHPNIQCSYNYTISSNILYFESWIGGSIKGQFGNLLTNNSDYSSDINFGNQMHLKVDKVTGLMLGFGQRGWVNGKIDKKTVKASLKIEYVLNNNEIQAYQLGIFNDYKSNYLLYILIPSIGFSILVCITIVIAIQNTKRRKNQ